MTHCRDSTAKDMQQAGERQLSVFACKDVLFRACFWLEAEAFGLVWFQQTSWLSRFSLALKKQYRQHGLPCLAGGHCSLSVLNAV